MRDFQKDGKHALLIFSKEFCILSLEPTDRCRPGMAGLIYGQRKRGLMARDIRETPILFGEDARRFLARMEERHPDPPEVRARRLRDYEFMKKAYERGMAEQRAREAANGGLDPWFKHV